MSHAGVRLYLATLLATASANLEVFAYNPKSEPLNDMLVINHLISSESRMSVPRGGGRKKVKYDADTILLVVSPDELIGQTLLDSYIQLVKNVLRTTPLPAIATGDGEVSSIFLIGENITVERTTAQQLQNVGGSEAQVLNSCLIGIAVEEIVIA